MQKASRLVQTTPCPTCGAKVKQFCKTKAGKPTNDAHHTRLKMMNNKKLRAQFMVSNT